MFPATSKRSSADRVPEVGLRRLGGRGRRGGAPRGGARPVAGGRRRAAVQYAGDHRELAPDHPLAVEGAGPLGQHEDLGVLLVVGVRRFLSGHVEHHVAGRVKLHVHGTRARVGEAAGDQVRVPLDHLPAVESAVLRRDGDHLGAVRDKQVARPVHGDPADRVEGREGGELRDDAGRVAGLLADLVDGVARADVEAAGHVLDRARQHRHLGGRSSGGRRAVRGRRARYPEPGREQHARSRDRDQPSYPKPSRQALHRTRPPVRQRIATISALLK